MLATSTIILIAIIAFLTGTIYGLIMTIILYPIIRPIHEIFNNLKNEIEIM